MRILRLVWGRRVQNSSSSSPEPSPVSGRWLCNGLRWWWSASSSSLLEEEPSSGGGFHSRGILTGRADGSVADASAAPITRPPETAPVSGRRLCSRLQWWWSASSSSLLEEEPSSGGGFHSRGILGSVVRGMGGPIAAGRYQPAHGKGKARDKPTRHESKSPQSYVMGAQSLACMHAFSLYMYLWNGCPGLEYDV